MRGIKSYPFLVPRKEKAGASLQENVHDWPSKFLFTWRRKNFCAVDNHVDFYRLWSQTPLEERNFYEIIREGRQKLHFDIDVKVPGAFTFAEAVKDHVIKGIEGYFASNVQQPFSIENDIILFTSHQQEESPLFGSSSLATPQKKYSYHIIVDNFAMPSSLHCRDFTRCIIAQMPENMREYVDDSVNKSNQQFRMWRSCKEGEVTFRFKEIQTEWTYFNRRIRFEPRHNNDPRWFQVAKDLSYLQHFGAE